MEAAMRWRATTLVVLMAAAAGPALAAYGSSASVAGLKYSLTDLRPDDGIAATVELPVPTVFQAGTYTELHKDRGSTVFSIDHISETFGSSFSQMSRPFASVAGAVQWANGSLSLASSGMASYAKNSFTSYLMSSYSMAHGLLAKLSPHTSISWTGSYILDAWAGPAAAGTDPARQTSTARVQVLLRDSAQDSILSYSANAFADLGEGPRKDHHEGLLSFTLTNDSNDFRYVLASVDVRAFGGVSPIPEPSTYALFAAGIVGLGVVARRRSSGAGAVIRT